MKAIGCFRIRRSLFRLSCLFLLLSPLLHAQTSESASTVPQPTTLEEAAAQRRLAEQMRTEAEARFAREQPACYKKILVNGCIEDAKKQRTQSMIEARKLDGGFDTVLEHLAYLWGFCVRIESQWPDGSVELIGEKKTERRQR